MKLVLMAVTGTFAAVSTAFGLLADQQPGLQGGGPQGRPDMRGPGPMGAPMGGRGHGIGMGPHEVVTNAPYSATFTSTSTQKLQDGTVLTHTLTRVVARDSQGRLREDITTTPGRGRKGITTANEKHTETIIHDPIAGTVTRWDDAKKEVHVMQLPAFAGRGHRGPGNGPDVARHDGQRGPGMPGPGGQGRPEREGNSFASTDLGSKMMDGVSVSGRRITHTISAGTMGNEEELVSSHESWFSPDLKVMISENDSDPFHGSHTLTTTNLTKAEPAATLFKVPEGYAVVQEQHRWGGPGQGRGPGQHHGPIGPGQQGPPPPPVS